MNTTAAIISARAPRTPKTIAATAAPLVKIGGSGRGKDLCGELLSPEVSDCAGVGNVSVIEGGGVAGDGNGEDDSRAEEVVGIVTDGSRLRLVSTMIEAETEDGVVVVVFDSTPVIWGRAALLPCDEITAVKAGGAADVTNGVLLGALLEAGGLLAVVTLLEDVDVDVSASADGAGGKAIVWNEVWLVCA